MYYWGVSGADLSKLSHHTAYVNVASKSDPSLAPPNGAAVTVLVPVGYLYFVGAGTHPGTGVPLVMISAKLVDERLERDGILPG